MKYWYISIFAMLCLFSCNKIKKGDDLSESELSHIRGLGLLEEGERIVKFYSEFKSDVAGNFYTNKRVATYWIDQRNSDKDEIDYAFYSEIESVDTVSYAGLTYSPFIRITKKDKTQFKVSVNGKKEEVKSFFNEVLTLCEQGRNIE